MKADAQIETAVKAVLDGMAENYAKRDLEGVIALFAPDSDVVMYGSGADEKRVGIAEMNYPAASGRGIHSGIDLLAASGGVFDPLWNKSTDRTRLVAI